jgi:hypothetical protein
VADAKLTALAALSPILSTDILYAVSDPGGTPVSKKITVLQLFTGPRVTTSILDTNGNPMFTFTATASAVDGFTFTNAATANPATVTIAATGSDTNINLQLAGKGSGDVLVSTGDFAVTTETGVVGIGGLTSSFAGIWTRSGATSQLVFGLADRSAPGLFWAGSGYFNDIVGGGPGAYINGASSGEVAVSQNGIFGATSGANADGTLDVSWSRAAASVLRIGDGGANALGTLTAANVKLGATTARGTTEGTNTLSLFNGTAPVGTLANGGSIYSSGGELFVIDAGGTATQISPHDSNGNWIFNSTNTTTGKRLKIDVEKMLRFLNEKFGTDFIHEFAR